LTAILAEAACRIDRDFLPFWQRRSGQISRGSGTANLAGMLSKGIIATGLTKAASNLV
tara:strand:+ start:114 stop:287 length:174 start_codon:yes stop_codon:yes gene_type:complete